MIDIDRFKAINDTYGHQVGDAVLARFGTLVMQAVGEAGEVARFGGEEFVVIACFHDLAEAQRLGEQIRLRVAADDWMAIHTGITLTTSVGVSAGEFTEVRRLVASADKALLEAKRLGRDRTVVRLPDEFGTLY